MKDCCNKWLKADMVIPFYGITSIIHDCMLDISELIYCPECGVKIKEPTRESEEKKEDILKSILGGINV